MIKFVSIISKFYKSLNQEKSNHYKKKNLQKYKHLEQEYPNMFDRSDHQTH